MSKKSRSTEIILHSFPNTAHSFFYVNTQVDTQTVAIFSHKQSVALAASAAARNNTRVLSRYDYFMGIRLDLTSSLTGLSNHVKTRSSWCTRAGEQTLNRGLSRVDRSQLGLFSH